MKLRRPYQISFGLAAVLGAAALAATPAHAQELEKKLTRSFNECTFPAPYVFDYGFFTADGPEAHLTFSRTHTSCSEVCPTYGPPPGINPCSTHCETAQPCPFGWTCQCFTQNCNSGRCIAGVDVFVGYVIVMKADRFRSIATCSPVYASTFPGYSCDGSGACTDATSNAESLCLCPDPACPTGQHICDNQRPSLLAGDVAFEAFAGATNADWFLGRATIASNVLGLNGTSPPTSIAEARFATTPGQEYAVLVKWTISPIVSGFQSCPDSSLLLSIDTRSPSCGP